MKKIITPAKREESEYFCDFHEGKPAYGSMRLEFWYPSNADGSTIHFDLSDDAAMEILTMISEKYPKTVITVDNCIMAGHEFSTFDEAKKRWNKESE